MAHLSLSTTFRHGWHAVLLCMLLSHAVQLYAQTIVKDERNLGLPPSPDIHYSALQKAKVDLGRMLFFDKRLSGDGTISCASCHQPERAFADGLPLAKGISGNIGVRNTPSLINASFNSTQFLDGRSPTLEAQALTPFINPQEHGLDSPNKLLQMVRSDSTYRKAFSTAFKISPELIQSEHIGLAIASFERRQLVAGNSPFDRYYFAGEKNSLSPAAIRGLALFQGAAQCATCHSIGKTDALFTDNKFHSVGIGIPQSGQRLSETIMRLVRTQEMGIGLEQVIGMDRAIAALGRFAVTRDPHDIGKFRTPSLRNIALTSPYMHDGSIETLEAAVELELYYRSNEARRPLILTAIEKADLVEFLKSLTSPLATKLLMPVNEVKPHQ